MPARSLALAATLTALLLAACGSSGVSARRYGAQVAAKATRWMRVDDKRQFEPRIAADAIAVRKAPQGAAQLAAREKLGIDIERALQAIWNRYAIEDADAMLEQFNRRIEQMGNEMPPASRDAAAKAMIAFARRLEAAGRLPQGATAGTIRNLEASYPGLAAYLAQSG
ncbi:MAG TPA: hypothetical protein VFU94_14925 [Conexibacter sp.]|nr:hypothetical protein [Conexibacter sp.]